MTFPNRNQIVDYLFGRLSPDEARALEQEARNDADLARAIEILRQEKERYEEPQDPVGRFWGVFRNKKKGEREEKERVEEPQGEEARVESYEKEDRLISEEKSASTRVRPQSMKRFSFIPKLVIAPKREDRRGLVFKRATIVPSEERVARADVVRKRFSNSIFDRSCRVEDYSFETIAENRSVVSRARFPRFFEPFSTQNERDDESTTLVTRRRKFETRAILAQGLINESASNPRSVEISTTRATVISSKSVYTFASIRNVDFSLSQTGFESNPNDISIDRPLFLGEPDVYFWDSWYTTAPFIFSKGQAYYQPDAREEERFQENRISANVLQTSEPRALPKLVARQAESSYGAFEAQSVKRLEDFTSTCPITERAITLELSASEPQALGSFAPSYAPLDSDLESNAESTLSSVVPVTEEAIPLGAAAEITSPSPVDALPLGTDSFIKLPEPGLSASVEQPDAVVTFDEQPDYTAVSSRESFAVEPSEDERELGPTLLTEDLYLAELLGREPTPIELDEYYWEEVRDEKAERSGLMSKILYNAMLAATTPPVLVGRATIGVFRAFLPSGFSRGEDFRQSSKKSRNSNNGRVSDMMISMIAGLLIAVIFVFPAIRYVTREVYMTVRESRVRKINMPATSHEVEEAVRPVIEGLDHVLYPNYTPEQPPNPSESLR